jgi:hypothetical protein
MMLTGVRFTVRATMFAAAALTGLGAGVIWAIDRRSPPAGFPAPERIYYAAVGAVPDLVVTSARRETVNKVRA